MEQDAPARAGLCPARRAGGGDQRHRYRPVGFARQAAGAAGFGAAWRRRREQVKVYATGMYFTETDDLAGKLADEAQRYAAQGFRALKMKVGLGVETDVKHVRAARAAIGDDLQLMVDANHAYSLSEALRFARQVEELDIGFFEEPVSPEDYDGYRELRQRTSIPIAGGECEYLLAGFRQLLSQRCVDIAQPDICGAGGLTETKRIAALATAFQTNVIPHSWGTGIAFAAGLHLVSTLDIVPGRLRMPEAMLEMDRSENALREKLTAPKFQLEDGRVAVPRAPGLGVDVDPDALAHLCAGGLSDSPRSDSAGGGTAARARPGAADALAAPPCRGRAGRDLS